MAPVGTVDAMSTASKVDNKKQLRKQEAAERARYEQMLHQMVKAAESDPAPLAAFAPFAKFDRNGLTATIRAVPADALPALPAPLAAWALDLCRANMQQLYEGVWGWSDKKKKRDLTHESSRFLIAFGAPPAAPAAPAAEGAAAAEAAAGAEAAGEAAAGAEVPLAYINYRFEVEDGEPVAYCYEVQLEAAAQRKGLGKHLMQILELMAARYGMRAVMLTVMRANSAAVAFYNKLGYVEHPTTPGSGDDPEEAATGYVILHKPIRRPVRPAAHHHHHHHGGGCCGGH